MNWIFKNFNYIALAVIGICILFWVGAIYIGTWLLTHPESIAHWLIRAGFAHQ